MSLVLSRIRHRRDQLLPLPHGAPPASLQDVLSQVREDSWRQCGRWSRRASSWGRWSVGLAVVATLGSGAAGAAVAASNTLSSTERAVIAILAFAGAALSGIAAAVGAPAKAQIATTRSDSLAALDRWAGLALVDLPTLSHDKAHPDAAHQLVCNILAWRDQIYGVQTPAAIRQGSGSPAPDNPAPDNPAPDNP